MPQDGKIPQDLNAERTVLGSILFQDEALLAVLSALPDPVVFSDTRHRRWYARILDLHQKQQPILPSSITGNMKEAEELTGYDSYRVYTQLDYFTQIILEKYKKRLAISILEAGINACRNGSEFNDAVGLVQKNISQIVMPSSKKIMSITDSLPNALQDIIDAESHKADYIYTGFSDIDRVVGGYEAGELIIVGGYPGHGKTTFAVQCGIKIAKAQKKPCCILSYEMSIRQLTMRLLCILSGADYAQVKQGTLSDETIRKINHAERLLNGLPIYIYNDPKCTINEMPIVMEKYKREFGIKFWIVDYLQLIPGVGKESRRLHIEEISRTLKLLAQQLEAPIMCLSQLSRQIDKGKHPPRPKLASLRESGSIEQDADLVHFVYRDEHNNSVLDIAKARMTKPAIIKMQFINGAWYAEARAKEIGYGI